MESLSHNKLIKILVEHSVHKEGRTWSEVVRAPMTTVTPFRRDAVVATPPRDNGTTTLEFVAATTLEVVSVASLEAIAVVILEDELLKIPRLQPLKKKPPRVLS